MVFFIEGFPNPDKYVYFNLNNLGISFLAPQKWIGERGSGFLILLTFTEEIMKYASEFSIKCKWEHNTINSYLQEGT